MPKNNRRSGHAFRFEPSVKAPQQIVRGALPQSRLAGPTTNRCITVAFVGVFAMYLVGGVLQAVPIPKKE